MAALPSRDAGVRSGEMNTRMDHPVRVSAPSRNTPSGRTVIARLGASRGRGAGSGGIASRGDVDGDDCAVERPPGPARHRRCSGQCFFHGWRGNSVPSAADAMGREPCWCRMPAMGNMKVAEARARFGEDPRCGREGAARRDRATRGPFPAGGRGRGSTRKPDAAMFDFVDPGVMGGQWTWRAGARGMQFAPRRKRR